MRQMLSQTIVLVSLLAASWCSPTVRAETKELSPLKLAINLIDKNPKLAEQKLKSQTTPSAKVYLAYLYMTQKVKIPEAGRHVDELMNEAISQISEPRMLGEVDRSKHYHYTDMKMFLKHLRFITDSDNFSESIPTSIFAEYPEAAFSAFQSYWGSTMDSFLSIDVRKEDDIQQIPQVASLIETLEEMFGSPNANCTGTIRYSFYRQQALALIEASLAPQAFITDQKNEIGQTAYKTLERFLQLWANDELWNKKKGQRLESESKAAEVPLANFYREHLGYKQDKAMACAKAALAGIRLGYLGNYSKSVMEETAGTTVYQIFSAQGLSLNEMERQISNKTLSTKELRQALRLTILNGGNIEVINWLIKQGAPLAGGKEPPLFTAVLRPEVVNVLLKDGANVNETNPVGKTALIQATQFDAFDTIKILIAAGADVQHKMVAADSDEAKAANDSCDFNYTIGGRTPLMYAAAFSSYPSIAYLLSKDADKNALDSDGARAVKYLAWNKGLSKVEKLKITQILAP